MKKLSSLLCIFIDGLLQVKPILCKFTMRPASLMHKKMQNKSLGMRPIRVISVAVIMAVV